MARVVSSARPPPKLPPRLTLPSGDLLRLRAGDHDGNGEKKPIARADGAPLFFEVDDALAKGRVVLTREDGASLAVGALPLRDFHVLRAVLARSLVIAEDAVAITCRNCDAPMSVRPCAALEIAPWVDGELDDPELDAWLPPGEAVDVPEIPLGRVRTASTVMLADRTVDEARPLFAAAAREGFDVNAEVVTAMGIVALGPETTARKIADALAHCDDDAFLAVGEAFLATHYVPRLACVVLCDECGARNDVDAPYEREMAVGAERGTAGGGDAASAFVSFDDFASRAHALAAPMLGDIPGDEIELVVEGETPAVDDGGEPLLGSYVPPHPGDAGSPSRPPVVTVYYRTFRAMHEEEGPYDWEDELHETIEHELEHHVAFLRGDDPTDDEERAVIRDEAVRVIGRREAERRAIQGFGASWSDFLRRTWPLWLLALVALLFTLYSGRD